MAFLFNMLANGRVVVCFWFCVIYQNVVAKLAILDSAIKKAGMVLGAGTCSVI